MWPAPSFSLSLPGASGSKAEVVTGEEAVSDAIVLTTVVSIEVDVDVGAFAEEGVCPLETEHPPIASERITVIVRTAVFLFIV